MNINFRIDGLDFPELQQALDYAAEKHFPAGADVQYEREPNRDGYEYTVFADAEISAEWVSVTIYEIYS